MSQRILLKFTIKNERGSKKNCEICNLKFQLLVKVQHQCKRCLRSVCEQCGPQRRTVYEPDGSKSPHRCCTICIKQIDEIDKYKSKHKLCFGQDSQFVSDWVGRLNKDRVSYDVILNEFSDQITGVTNQNTIRYKRQSQAIFQDLISSCNYSLRHFLQEITYDVNEELVQGKLRSTMVGIYGKIKALPYIPELIYLVAFFLCFANEAHTYFIITRMIEKIYPQYVRVKKMQKDNLLASTLKTILQMYRVCIGKVDRNQLQIVAQYLEERFCIFVLSFTLNICSMPCSFFIISQMLKTGSCLPFYKGIAAMVSTCRQQIASYKSFSQVEIPILRKVSDQKLRSCFILFEKNDAKFEVTNEVFDSVQHRKLHEKYKQLQNLYAKSEKSLTEKQVKIKQMISQLNLRKKQIELEQEKSKRLQLQVLKISSNIPKLSKFQQMSQQCQQALNRNKELEERCSQLQKNLHKIEKERALEGKKKVNWAKVEQEMNKQLISLRTKVQILQIEVSAKEIDFNTSFIEKKLEDKNIQINILHEQIKLLKSQLEFYKLKVLQKSYGQGKTNTKSAVANKNYEAEKERQFEKFINNSKDLVQKLEKQINDLTTNYENSLKKIHQLEEKNMQLSDKISQIEQVSKIIQQIPEDYNYIEGMEQLERVSEKETNFIKKKILQSVKDSFTKCYRQLRFRAIDCKIKENTIKNSFLVNLLNPDNFSKLPKNNQLEDNANPDEDEVFNILNQVGSNLQGNQIQNKNCSLM